MKICNECGREYKKSDVIKKFNHYFSESSRWEYEEVIDGDYCFECAVDNVYERYNNGDLIDEYEDEE